MSQLQEPVPGFLFSSIIFHEDHFNESDLIELWIKRYGEGSILKTDFNPSLQYYAKEMGDIDKLNRFIYCSLKPHPRSEFVQAKIWATDFEKKKSVDDARMVNIDIGYLNLENMLLATGKNYSHRVYISDGIFADINYQFQSGQYTFFPWTYPDYQEDAKRFFFEQMRQQLLKMHKQL